jgi:hypothetical protein
VTPPLLPLRKTKGEYIPAFHSVRSVRAPDSLHAMRVLPMVGVGFHPGSPPFGALREGGHLCPPSPVPATVVAPLSAKGPDHGLLMLVDG